MRRPGDYVQNMVLLTLLTTWHSVAVGQLFPVPVPRRAHAAGPSFLVRVISHRSHRSPHVLPTMNVDADSDYEDATGQMINLLYPSKRNKHICLPPALIALLKSDADFEYDASLLHVLDSVQPGFRDAMLRQYVLAACPPYFAISQPDPADWADVPRDLAPPLQSLIDEFRGCENVTHLHLAARTADVPLAYECIRLGTNVNCCDSRGRTPLYLAVTEVVKHHHRRPDATGEVAAATAASLKRRRHIARVLLEQHADPRLTAHEDTLSPVAWAWYSLDVELVELFARHGAPEVANLPLRPLPFQPSVLRWASNPDRVTAIGQLASGFTHDGCPPRPPRQCPCLSGKPLSECHGPNGLPYPSHFPCTCGTSKTCATCCGSRDFEIVEKWDEQRQCLSVVRFDGKSATSESESGADAAQPPLSRSPLTLLTEVANADPRILGMVQDDIECMKLIVKFDEAFPDGHDELRADRRGEVPRVVPVSLRIRRA